VTALIKRAASLVVLMAMLCGACSRGAEVRYRVSYSVDDNGVTRSAAGVWSSTVRPSLLPLAEKYNSDSMVRRFRFRCRDAACCCCCRSAM
jgi:hypothetical protein